MTSFSIPVAKDSIYSELQDHNIFETGIKNAVGNLFPFNREEISINKDKLKDVLNALKLTARNQKMSLLISFVLFLFNGQHFFSQTILKINP